MESETDDGSKLHPFGDTTFKIMLVYLKNVLAVMIRYLNNIIPLVIDWNEVVAIIWCTVCVVLEAALFSVPI